MCALRDYRSISAVSLANQYRLDVKPKRPVPKVLNRKKKPTVDTTTDNDNVKQNNIKVEETYHDDKRASIHWMLYDEPDAEFDFDAEDEFLDAPPDTSDLCQRYYLQACEDLGVRPIRCVYLGLHQDSMACKGTMLHKNETKAITIALVGNSYTETIVFDGNEIGQEAACYFGDVFSRNAYLTDITLSWNNLGTKGAEAICKALLKNENVKKLDLTGNKFKETDAVFFKELLVENSGIHELYLGHNYFREAGGEMIADGVAANDFVKVLDLSWNHLRLRGAMAIGKALTTNIQLEVLNVSWNGFYLHGVVHLATALSQNKNLLDLDISCNRLSEYCMDQFLCGLQKNSTLKALRMKMNHISHVGAMNILQHIKAHPEVGLEFVDLGDQHVHEDFLEVLAEIQETRPLEVKYGVVWSICRDPIGKSDTSEDEIALLKENPHFVLMEFMRLMKYRLVDLFHQMDKDNSRGISIDEFKAGLEAVDIPLKRKALEKFVARVDADKNGEIEFSELMEAHRIYKEELRRHVKNGTPLENTCIGTIQKLIRKLLISNGSIKGEKEPIKGEQEPVVKDVVKVKDPVDTVMLGN